MQLFIQRTIFKGNDDGSSRINACIVGQDTLSDIPRFVFNNMNLSDGISFVLVVMATFAMSEALMIILRGTDPSSAAKAFHLKN